MREGSIFHNKLLVNKFLQQREGVKAFERKLILCEGKSGFRADWRGENLKAGKPTDGTAQMEV